MPRCSHASVPDACSPPVPSSCTQLLRMQQVCKGVRALPVLPEARLMGWSRPNACADVAKLGCVRLCAPVRSLIGRCSLPDRSGAQRHGDWAGHRAVQLLAVAHHAVLLHHVQVHHARLPARLLLPVGHRAVRAAACAACMHGPALHAMGTGLVAATCPLAAAEVRWQLSSSDAAPTASQP